MKIFEDPIFGEMELSESQAVAAAGSLKSRQVLTPRSKQIYRNAWQRFSAWCSAQGVSAADLGEERIAEYLAAASSRYSANTVRTHLSVICGARRMVGTGVDTGHPAIRSFLTAEPARERTMLVPEVLTTVLDHMPKGAAGLRDKAVILLMFWSGASNQDILAANMADLVLADDQVMIFAPDDRTGSPRIRVQRAVRPRLCPEAALRAWLDRRGPAEGPLFPRIRKGGQITSEPLGVQQIGRMVKCAAAEAGYPPEQFSSRSLRLALHSVVSLSGGSPRRSNAPHAPSAGLHPPPAMVPSSLGYLPSDELEDPSLHWQIHLGLLIDEMSRHQSTIIDRGLQKFGTTRSQFIVLNEIVRVDGVPQSELAQRLHLNKVSLSTMVDRLVAGGWVVRRSDPSDGRIRRIHATARAKEEFAQLREVVEDITRALFRLVPDLEGRNLTRLLSYLLPRLQTIAESADG